MIPPPAGGGASLSTQQLFVRCPDASLAPPGPSERVNPLRTALACVPQASGR